MTTTQNTCTIWVCVDCRDIEANGGTRGMDPDRTFDREPWAYIDRDESVIDTTPGLMAEEHDDGCPNFDDDGTYLGTGDCYCEDQEFSWHMCEGCGSHLGGSRHAYTIWLKEE